MQRTVNEDVTSYGEVVADIDVDDPRLDDAGRADAQRALDAYETAKKNADAMTRPEDAALVTTALEDGRFALACVERADRRAAGARAAAAVLRRPAARTERRGRHLGAGRRRSRAPCRCARRAR